MSTPAPVIGSVLSAEEFARIAGGGAPKPEAIPVGTVLPASELEKLSTQPVGTVLTAEEFKKLSEPESKTAPPLAGPGGAIYPDLKLPKPTDETLLGRAGDFARGAVGGVKSMLSGADRMAKVLTSLPIFPKGDVDTSESPINSLAGLMGEAAEKLPESKTPGFAKDLTTAAGSMLPYVAGALAGGPVVPALMGSAQHLEEQVERRTAGGMTEEEAVDAKVIAAAVAMGASEAAPIQRILGRAAKLGKVIAKGRSGKVAGEIAKGSGEEAIQEGGTELAHQALNPEEEIAVKDALYNAAIGGVLGGVLSGGVAAKKTVSAVTEKVIADIEQAAGPLDAETKEEVTKEVQEVVEEGLEAPQKQDEPVPVGTVMSEQEFSQRHETQPSGEKTPPIREQVAPEDTILDMLDAQEKRMGEGSVGSMVKKIRREGGPEGKPPEAPKPPAPSPEKAAPSGSALADAERVTAPVEPEKKSFVDSVRRFPATLQKLFTSEFTPLRRAESAVRTARGEKIPELDMARKFEQQAGAHGKAEADIIEFKERVVDRIPTEHKDFNTYLFLKRTESRLRNNAEVKRVAGWDLAKVEEALGQLRGKVGAEAFGELETVATTAYQQEMDKSLQLQVSSGRMTQETYDRIKKANDFYAPFKVLQGMSETEGIPGAGRPIATTQDLTRAIKGIDKADFSLGDFLSESATIIYRSRILAEKNLKMLELDKLKEMGGEGNPFQKADPDRHYPIESEPGKKPKLGVRFGTKPKKGHEILEYFKDGTRAAMEVPREIATAVQGLNRGEASVTAKFMAMAAMPMRVGATGANVAFQPVNFFFADLPRAALLSRYGIRSTSPKELARFIGDYIYSAFTSVKGNFGKPNELYKQFLESGAANSTMQRHFTPEVWKPDLREKRQIAKTVLSSVPKISNAIEETAKLVGIRRGFRIEGIAKLEPAKAAEKIQRIVTEVRNYSGSPDFLRGGQMTRSQSLENLNLLFMFFNARMQGISSDLTRLAGKTGKKEGLAANARIAAVAGTPALTLALYNLLPGNVEDYEKRPQWEKDNYFMIPRGSYSTNYRGEEVRDYWRIPKREITKLFGNMVEASVEFAHKGDSQAIKDYALHFLENISPFSIEGDNMQERVESMVGSMNPVVKVPVEYGLGRDTFRKRDTIPQFIEGVPTKHMSPEEQYTKQTAEVFKTAGKYTGVSPLILEQATRGLTAGLFTQFSPRKEPGRSEVLSTPLVGTVAKRFVGTQNIESEDAEDTEAVKKKLTEQADEKVKLKRQAQKEFEDLEGYENSDRRTPELDAAVKKLVDDEKLGLTYHDKKIRQLGVANGKRAQYIYSKLMGMPREEWEEYGQELSRKKLLSEAVLEQVKDLLGEKQGKKRKKDS